MFLPDLRANVGPCLEHTKDRDVELQLVSLRVDRSEEYPASIFPVAGAERCTDVAALTESPRILAVAENFLVLAAGRHVNIGVTARYEKDGRLERFFARFLSKRMDIGQDTNLDRHLCRKRARIVTVVGQFTNPFGDVDVV